MEKYAILLGYFNKQIAITKKLYNEIIHVNLTLYEHRFLFAMRVQQFYTALEDLFKQIAKTFENNIESMTHFHKEILTRMSTEVPKIRPAIISNHSFVLLDKIRAFRHFIRHAYDCELNENELQLIQKKLLDEYPHIDKDLEQFRLYIKKLSR